MWSFATGLTPYPFWFKGTSFSATHYNVTFIYTLLLQLLNVQVPFLFKYAVDFLNNLDPSTLAQTAGGTTFTVLTALLLGCKWL